MSWFIGQSLLMILLGLALGLLVGYLIWGRRFVRLDQASALRATDPATVLPHQEPAAARAAVAPAAVEVEPYEVEPYAVEPYAVEPDAVEPYEVEPQYLAEPVAEAAPEPEVWHDAEPEPDVAVQAQPVEAEPATLLDVPAPEGRLDRLELIEGIGPKIATALRSAGINTFAKLADTDETTLRDALAVANLRFAPSLATWGPQAQLLADGDHEGHAALTAQLVAGRAPRSN